MPKPTRSAKLNFVLTSCKRKQARKFTCRLYSRLFAGSLKACSMQHLSSHSRHFTWNHEVEFAVGTDCVHCLAVVQSLSRARLVQSPRQRSLQRTTIRNQVPTSRSKQQASGPEAEGAEEAESGLQHWGWIGWVAEHRADELPQKLRSPQQPLTDRSFILPDSDRHFNRHLGGRLLFWPMWQGLKNPHQKCNHCLMDSPPQAAPRVSSNAHSKRHMTGGFRLWSPELNTNYKHSSIFQKKN